MSAAEHREHPRYRVHWKTSLVIEGRSRIIIHHGHTHDISLGGASIYTELNLFAREPVTMILAIPNGVSEKDWASLDIRCRMIYTVLSSNHDKFRIGLHFLSLKDGNRRILEEALRSRISLKAP